jgi:hypothetical protein
MDAKRYLVMSGLGLMQTKPAVHMQIDPATRNYGDQAWMM